MSVKTRSQIVMPTDKVRLFAQFNGPDGMPIDLDTFPSISIRTPSGGIILGPTSQGVFREALGVYGFEYALGFNPPFGTWVDIWEGTLNGLTIYGSFTFTVANTQLPATNTDGYIHLGDDPGFNFSQTAIRNINNLLKTFRARLNSAGKHRTNDEFGNAIYVDCDIYSIDQLVAFLCASLSAFNEIPHFTLFTFDDTSFVQQFHEVLVQHATIYALASKALIERGREFNITDNGFAFQPPSVADLLNSQYSTELQNWYEKIKLIKYNLKPYPLGLKREDITSARNPYISRLRNLRARQII